VLGAFRVGVSFVFGHRKETRNSSSSKQCVLFRHSWGTYLDQPPSMAEGGNGAAVPVIVEHLEDDPLPVILRRAFFVPQNAVLLPGYY
jgi:hypothetical protein